MFGDRFSSSTGCSRCRMRPRLRSSQASSTVFSQFLPFVALTRFGGVCFRLQRLRLARLMGEFSDGFLTVVAATAMLYGLAARCCSNGFRAATARPRRKDALCRAGEPTFPNHHPLLRSPQRSCSDRSLFSSLPWRTIYPKASIPPFLSNPLYSRIVSKKMSVILVHADDTPLLTSTTGPRSAPDRGRLDGS